jgi:hypothetical protein
MGIKLSPESERGNTVPFFSLMKENDWFNNPVDIWQLTVWLYTMQPDHNLLETHQLQLTQYHTLQPTAQLYFVTYAT